MMLKLLVLVMMTLVYGLLVDVPGPYSFAQQEWKTYVDPVNNFSIDYPPAGSASVNVDTNGSLFNDTSVSLPTNDFTFEVAIINKSSTLSENITNALQFAVYEKDNITIPAFGNESIFRDLAPVSYPNFNGSAYSAVLYGHDIGDNVIIKKVFVDYAEKIFYFFVRDDIKSYDERTSEAMMNTVKFFN